MESPFVLPRDIERSFKACPTLRAVREHLSLIPDTTFCHEHHHLSADLFETYLLHRDMLHALIVPVVALYSRTAAIASAALCSSRPSDLELAYREDARSAFLSMQCLFDGNEAWCYSRACPACVVHHTLSEEAPLRLAITAALMAQEATPLDPLPTAAASTDNQPQRLSDNMNALQRAVSNDPFWGPQAWTVLLDKATALHLSIKDLTTQASELSSLVLSPQLGPSRIASADRTPHSPPSIRAAILAAPTRPSTPGFQSKAFPTTEAEFKRAVAKLARSAGPAAAMGEELWQRHHYDDDDRQHQRQQQQQQALPNLRPSPLAKRQLRMDAEQRALMRSEASQDHTAVSVSASEKLAAWKRGRRRYRDEDPWEGEAAGVGRSKSTPI